MPVHTNLDARGKRILFALVHAAFMILNVAALVATAAERAITYPIHWEVSTQRLQAILAMDTWGTFGRLTLLAMGIYLMALIVRGDQRVPRFYWWYGLLFLVFEGVYELAELGLWVFPHGTSYVSYGIRVASYSALIVWVAKVRRSSKAREIFTNAPRPLGPVGRLLIGLLAVALITWPFVMNVNVEVMTYLAWRIYPKDSTAASGIVSGLLAMSVTTGLFVLMKNTWRMKNAWIAVLLPVCFGALLYCYVFQGFMLYYRF